LEGHSGHVQALSQLLRGFAETHHRSEHLGRFDSCAFPICALVRAVLEGRLGDVDSIGSKALAAAALADAAGRGKN